MTTVDRPQSSAREDHDEVVASWPAPTAEQVETLRRCLPPVEPEPAETTQRRVAARTQGRRAAA